MRAILTLSEIAQLEEHLILDQTVAGSTPALRAMKLVDRAARIGEVAVVRGRASREVAPSLPVSFLGRLKPEGHFFSDGVSVRSKQPFGFLFHDDF